MENQLSSLASALAGSGAVLFAASAGQGLGAAMLSPAALSIITTEFKGPERTKALGAWGAVGGAGAAIGVLLGGALTELDWRAVFLINLPVGLALALAARKVVPAESARPSWHGLDLRGALLATISLAAHVYAISQADSEGWTSVQTLGVGTAALLGLAAFAALERRTTRPLLRVERLADRAVGGGFVLMLAASAVLFGTFVPPALPVGQLSRVDRLGRHTVPAATRTRRPRGSCAGRRARSSRKG
jgi:MFS family permease